VAAISSAAKAADAKKIKSIIITYRIINLRLNV
jgi:hypothetical protein